MFRIRSWMDLVDAIIVRASVRKHLPLSRTGGQRFHGGVPYSSCVWSQDGVVGPLQRFFTTRKLGQQATSGPTQQHARHLGRPALSLDEASTRPTTSVARMKYRRRRGKIPRTRVYRTDSRLLKLRLPHGSAPRLILSRHAQVQ